MICEFEEKCKNLCDTCLCYDFCSRSFDKNEYLDDELINDNLSIELDINYVCSTDKEDSICFTLCNDEEAEINISYNKDKKQMSATLEKEDMINLANKILEFYSL